MGIPDDTTICVCKACGVVNEDALERLVLTRESLRDAERDLVAKRAQMRSMRTRNKQPELDPLYDDANKVFGYWQSRLSPRSREFSGDRFKNVTDRLRAGAEVDELKRAIDGCALLPYVSDGRRAATGTSKERRCDLELICRSEAHVERFAAYLETEKEETDVGADLYPPSRVLAMQKAIDHPRVLQRLYELRHWAESTILELGLGLDDGRVVFFAHDADGRITGLCRYQPNPKLRGEGPKLIAQGARELFPPPENLDTSTVWLVEGEADAVAVRSVGLPAVAVPGVATWKEGWPQRFEAFTKVYVCFDCDDTGREAAQLRRAQLARYTDVHVVDLDPQRDDGYDVGDLLIERGEGASSVLSSLATVTGSRLGPYQSQLGSEDPLEAFKRLLVERECRIIATNNGTITAQCPNHDDRKPSLSVSQGEDGRVLVHCHAGCTTDDVVGALGLKLRDLFPAT